MSVPARKSCAWSAAQTRTDRGRARSFPLLPDATEAPVAPAPAAEEDDDKNAHQPILGHVSMLTSLALIPADPSCGLTHDWIATGDRDEHIRISRFPAGHVIEKFAWGSKS